MFRRWTSGSCLYVSSASGRFRTLTMLSLQILDILYLRSSMDRGNIGHSRLAALEVDL